MRAADRCRWRRWRAPMAWLRVIGPISPTSVSPLRASGLFAWISGSALVLQNTLRPHAAQFRRCLCARVGRLHDRLGSGGTHAAETGARPCPRAGICLRRRGPCHGGGGCVRADIARVARSPDCDLSRWSRHGAAARHRRSHGAISGTRPVLRRRCSDLCSRSVAAVCGAAVGWFLGHDAWPLALGVAAMGCATLGLWLATRGIRQAGAKR